MTNANTATATTDKAVDTSTTNTTTSGDAKGDAQEIKSTDVGNLNDVLGNLTNAAVTGNTTAEIVDKINDQANGTSGSIAEVAAAAVATETKAAEVKVAATGGNATQRAAVTKVTPVPAQSAVKANVAAAPVAKVTAAPTVTKTGAVAVAQLPEVVAALEVAKMQSSSALNNILAYVKDMHQGQPQNAASIERNQLKLLSALQTILIAEDENFNVVWKGVLAIFKANRNDAFSVTMRNRGLNTISMATMPNETMRFLTRVVDAMVVASGVNDISQVKSMVDMTKLLSSVVNVRAKQNLTAFFS